MSTPQTDSLIRLTLIYTPKAIYLQGWSRNKPLISLVSSSYATTMHSSASNALLTSLILASSQSSAASLLASPFVFGTFSGGVLQAAEPPASLASAPAAPPSTNAGYNFAGLPFDVAYAPANAPIGVQSAPGAQASGSAYVNVVAGGKSSVSAPAAVPTGAIPLSPGASSKSGITTTTTTSTSSSTLYISLGSVVKASSALNDSLSSLLKQLTGSKNRKDTVAKALPNIQSLLIAVSGTLKGVISNLNTATATSDGDRIVHEVKVLAQQISSSIDKISTVASSGADLSTLFPPLQTMQSELHTIFRSLTTQFTTLSQAHVLADAQAMLTSSVENGLTSI
ncbi:unnamed protein product [Mycena citricolor]|uniref:Uncharacterized protein n=1 Tax=Mycena citricolor TaxID=2018698 RepID=A0AAD2I0K0_9AGAR|nr:unnamed protein product [Mycena citricolor]